jgi:hypothetical protein
MQWNVMKNEMNKFILMQNFKNEGEDYQYGKYW